MAQIYLCFLWHMHQPFYKDLISGEYKLPWTRMHALKDYWGMAAVLEEFPSVHQTFNLVPSMMVQVAEYAAGEANDPFLQAALKPAENLNEAERQFLLQHSFHADANRMIYRYPRYGELYDARQKQRQSGGRYFGVQEYRDLQMLSQVAWFDEDIQTRDAEVAEWIRRGRNFTLADQRRMGEKQRETIGRVLPVYQRMAATGQIEISTTPYYHPILPLLCDSNIAGVSHPHVPLPPRFRYPNDARLQLTMAREYIEREFGVAPAGLWPSEGSVSDEVFTIASEMGFQWAATDSGVLNRTLGRGVGVDGLYRPYRWEQQNRSMGVIFRDHYLSDLIGFVYSKMDARAAAGDFLHRIRENSQGFLTMGRDALVPIILDGENAWEYYDQNGRPFLRELYRRISEDPMFEALTVSEALRRLEPQRIDHIFPGSWINANFDVWIGAEEDNQAWTQLLRARETFDATTTVSAEQRRLAFEELLIAEGSDWCWWYGPEHHSDNRLEFDQLYRSHLANVYRFLHLTPPEELSRPILRVSAGDVLIEPSSAITPSIDGEVTSFFEWMGAGMCRPDERSGSMHGRKVLVSEMHYGVDPASFYLRLDLNLGGDPAVEPMELRLSLRSMEGEPRTVQLAFSHGTARTVQPVGQGVECAFGKVLEARIPLAFLGVEQGGPLSFQMSLWQGGLPMDAIPQQGWIHMATTDPEEWPGF
jgi:alpha-amylase/alpha-mannosidase (GH57 family)